MSRQLRPTGMRRALAIASAERSLVSATLPVARSWRWARRGAVATCGVAVGAAYASSPGFRRSVTFWSTVAPFFLEYQGIKLRARIEGCDGAVLEQRNRLVRLDGESLDALAVVAWHQPLPRDRLVEFGCDARPVTLRTLVRRGLLAIEKPADGGEPAYVTTRKFLDVFKLESLADLPSPHEPPG